MRSRDSSAAGRQVYLCGGVHLQALCVRRSSGQAQQIRLQRLQQGVSDESRIVPQAEHAMLSAARRVLRAQLLWILRSGEICGELQIRCSGGL